ncbi:MAG: type I restriction enzyme HsdR N-terminal domain-containing protein, partial [Desulfovibrionaceae bacterium]|nr:type I restriction enzyme HsdR N-terminal domain-containing protein [Desulfovibrionaceae bacterium]
KILGYNIFNPIEVATEYNASMGVKKEARVDYALLDDEGKPRILIECKAYDDPLETDKCSQLMMYFNAIKDAHIGILTNGRRWLFFTDIDAAHIMDKRPYMEIDLEKLNRSLIPALEKLTKNGFILTDILTDAERLKYKNEFKNEIARQFQEPDEEFSRFFIQKVYQYKIMQSVKDKLIPILKDSLNSFLSEEINKRLQNALDAQKNRHTA